MLAKHKVVGSTPITRSIFKPLVKQGLFHFRASSTPPQTLFPDKTLSKLNLIIISLILAREIRAENIFVRGEVDGNIQVASRVGVLEAGVLIGDVKVSSLTIAVGSPMRGKVEFGSDERGAGVVLPVSGPPTSIRLYPPFALVSVGSS